MILDERRLQHVVRAGFAPMLWRWAREAGAALPAEWLATLHAADLTAQVVYGEVRDATIDILDACRELDVRVTLLKGVSIGDQYYPAPHLRPMGDIDLLVAERDREPVEAMLLRRGYARMPGFREEAGDPHGAPLFLPERRVWVELHTGLFPEGDRLRRDRLFAPDTLEHYAVDSAFAGRPVRRLSAELQLVYLASYWMRDMSNYGPNPTFAKSLFDAVYLLGPSGPDFDWDGMLEWLDNDFARASLYALVSFLATRGLCRVPEGILARLAAAQDIAGALENRILGAMIDRGLIEGRPLLGSFGERHPMIAETVLRSMLSDGSPAAKLLSLPWAMVFPPWIAERYTLRYQRERLGRLLRRRA